MFVQQNYHVLKTCHESLRVPFSHGGLGKYWREGFNEKTAKAVYFVKLLRKLKDTKGCKSFEKITGKTLLYLPSIRDRAVQKDKGDETSKRIRQIQAFGSPNGLPDCSGDDFLVTPRRLETYQKLFHDRFPQINRIINNGSIKLESLPCLDLIQIETRVVDIGVGEQLRSKAVNDFLNREALYPSPDENLTDELPIALCDEVINNISMLYRSLATILGPLFPREYQELSVESFDMCEDSVEKLELRRSLWYSQFYYTENVPCNDDDFDVVEVSQEVAHSGDFETDYDLTVSLQS
jgi:hypothetical protein